MKNLVVRFTMILFIAGQAACTSISNRNIVLERHIDLSSVDLTEYAKAGFLITPHPYGGNYDALSFFQISGHERVVVIKTPSGKRTAVTSTGDYVTFDDILEEAVFFAKKIGGDAITGVRWSFSIYDHSYNPALLRDNVQLSGWVIKRNLPGNVSSE